MVLFNISKLTVSVAVERSIVGSSAVSFQFKTCLDVLLDFDPHAPKVKAQRATTAPEAATLTNFIT